MGDRKPPTQADDERETLLGLLQFQRESLVRKAEGITDEQARWSPVPTGTSLLWLVRHVTMAESIWILHRFAGEPRSVVASDRLVDGDTVADAVADYRAMWERVDAVAEAASQDDHGHTPTADQPINHPWVLAHLLEETARHAGHADLIREQIDGSVGR